MAFKVTYRCSVDGVFEHINYYIDSQPFDKDSLPLVKLTGIKTLTFVDDTIAAGKYWAMLSTVGAGVEKFGELFEVIVGKDDPEGCVGAISRVTIGPVSTGSYYSMWVNDEFFEGDIKLNAIQTLLSENFSVSVTLLTGDLEPVSDSGYANIARFENLSDQYVKIKIQMVDASIIENSYEDENPTLEFWNESYDYFVQFCLSPTEKNGSCQVFRTDPEAEEYMYILTPVSELTEEQYTAMLDEMTIQVTGMPAFRFRDVEVDPGAGQSGYDPFTKSYDYAQVFMIEPIETIIDEITICAPYELRKTTY